MNVITEVIGGIVLLAIFAYGVAMTIQLFKEKQSGHQSSDQNAVDAPVAPPESNKSA
jgi:hypothetical protein